jgi:ABC-type Fe3+-siderophore transport system permease subunit
MSKNNYHIYTTYTTSILNTFYFCVQYPVNKMPVLFARRKRNRIKLFFVAFCYQSVSVSKKKSLCSDIRCTILVYFILRKEINYSLRSIRSIVVLFKFELKSRHLFWIEGSTSNKQHSNRNLIYFHYFIYMPYSKSKSMCCL